MLHPRELATGGRVDCFYLCDDGRTRRTLSVTFICGLVTYEILLLLCHSVPRAVCLPCQVWGLYVWLVRESPTLIVVREWVTHRQLPGEGGRSSTEFTHVIVSDVFSDVTAHPQ